MGLSMTQFLEEDNIKLFNFEKTAKRIRLNKKDIKANWSTTDLERYTKNTIYWCRDDWKTPGSISTGILGLR